MAATMRHLLDGTRVLPSTLILVGVVGAMSMMALAAGCGSNDDGARTGLPGAKPAQGEARATVSDEGGERSFTLVGEVVQLDRESGSVAIRHEEIPDYMPAMTMPFDLSGQEVLDDLEVGDEVEGTLLVGESASRLTDLNITRPALAPPTPPDPEGANRARNHLALGEPVPDFTVTTQAGEPLALSDLRGHVVTLTFIYTRCPLPDFCPRIDSKFKTLSNLASMLPEATEQRVRLLTVSFDPEHDTPEVLSRHAAMLGARPPLWTFAVADHGELAKVAEPLGLSYGPTPNEILHNLVTAVIDPEGRLIRLENGGDWNPEDLYRTIAQAAVGVQPAP